MLEQLLQAVVDEPRAEDRWSVLADWLEEHDDPRRTELLRLHRRLIATCCEPEKHPERAEWQARIVVMLVEGVRPCVPQRTILLGARKTIPMTFSWIPPGSYLMGSPPQEEGRQDDETLHLVTLTVGFWMGIHPITQAQWRWAMGTAPGDVRGDGRYPRRDDSWEGFQEFSGMLGRKTRQRFRMPTEAEWEWACRSGTTTPYHFGQALLPEHANDDASREAVPVGSYPPNAWGLFDTHANVAEWCQDWYGDYPEKGVTDPDGFPSGRSRVLRGGSWKRYPLRCRSASRDWNRPDCYRADYGCRLVLCPD